MTTAEDSASPEERPVVGDPSRAVNGPPTMPAAAREGWDAPPPPSDMPEGPAADDPGAAGIPPGTGPDVPTAEGTSERFGPARGVHTPDDGPGGTDVDTSARPLRGRVDHDRD